MHPDEMTPIMAEKCAVKRTATEVNTRSMDKSSLIYINRTFQEYFAECKAKLLAHIHGGGKNMFLILNHDEPFSKTHDELSFSLLST